MATKVRVNWSTWLAGQTGLVGADQGAQRGQFTQLTPLYSPGPHQAAPLHHGVQLVRWRTKLHHAAPLVLCRTSGSGTTCAPPPPPPPAGALIPGWFSGSPWCPVSHESRSRRGTQDLRQHHLISSTQAHIKKPLTALWGN